MMFHMNSQLKQLFYDKLEGIFFTCTVPDSSHLIILANIVTCMSIKMWNHKVSVLYKFAKVETSFSVSTWFLIGNECTCFKFTFFWTCVWLLQYTFFIKKIFLFYSKTSKFTPNPFHKLFYTQTANEILYSHFNLHAAKCQYKL